MKIRASSPWWVVAGFALALGLGGCGNAAQQKAYEHAAQLEEKYTAESAPAIIREYQRVIALEPDSGWAKKARTRLEALEARVKAEEQHKNIFQEHGVD